MNHPRYLFLVKTHCFKGPIDFPVESSRKIDNVPKSIEPQLSLCKMSLSREIKYGHTVVVCNQCYINYQTIFFMIVINVIKRLFDRLNHYLARSFLLKLLKDGKFLRHFDFQFGNLHGAIYFRRNGRIRYAL